MISGPPVVAPSHLPRVPILDHHRCRAWSWFTYPHSNGFLADGRALVRGRFDGSDTVLARCELASGREEELFRFPAQGPEPVVRWYDISLRGDRLLTLVDDRVLIADLAGDGRLREAYRAQGEWRLHVSDIPAISADGRRTVLRETRQDGSPFGQTRFRELELDTGALSELFTTDQHLNHVHYCPADESWIGLSHEGPTDRIPDRVWAWHRRLAPQGRCLFAQASEVPGTPLCVGHERWLYHRPGALAVAYGVSPQGPRGIWEIAVDGRPPRLVSRGERDFHLNVDRAGTRVVIDTTGSLDCPGRGWDNNDRLSDILIADLGHGGRSWLARLDASALRFPGHLRHPFHPHPHFAPDGRAVVFNDYADGLPAVSVVRF
jgi:hypothetical protein